MITKKAVAQIISIGCLSLLYVWTCIAFGQGFFDTRVGLISREDGPCIFENTKIASDGAMQGERVPVHVVKIQWSSVITTGHLYAGDHIDFSAPPTGVKERFTFTTSQSAIATLLSFRTGPAWRWTEIGNITDIAGSWGTYAGHLWRQKISAEIDRVAMRASALRYMS